jgi:hypothetical protein
MPPRLLNHASLDLFSIYHFKSFLDMAQQEVKITLTDVFEQLNQLKEVSNEKGILFVRGPVDRLAFHARQCAGAGRNIAGRRSAGAGPNL